MSIYVKSGSYTLTQPFVAGRGVYAEVNASSLRFWSRFRVSPVDESGNSITVSYTGSPDISNQQIPSSKKSRIQDLPVATFDGTSDNAAVAATSRLDFSGDLPFTISGWINKPDDGNTGNIFDMPNVAASATGWGGFVSSTKSISFVIKGTGGKITISTDADVFITGEWTHFAMTYDGSKLASGMSIYMNGEKLPVSETVTGAFTTIDADGSRSLKIFANYNASSRMAGSLSDLAVWGVSLSDSAVQALYHSTAGRYRPKSGIISRPTRVIIRSQDNERGNYPQQLRTTGKSTDKGNNHSLFDDTRVQLFNSIDNARFPLVNSDQNLNKLGLNRLIASPNQNSTLAIPGTASPDLSTEGTIFPSPKGSEIPIEPFNESAILLKDKEIPFYASGTSIDIYPGYPSPLRDKIAIKVKIDNREEKIISRYSANEIEVDPAGLFSSDFKSSGFYYYNFNLSKWEDIGLRSNHTMFYTASKDPTIKTSCVTLGADIKNAAGVFGDNLVSANLLPKVYQFKMSDHMGVMIDSVADTRASNPDPYSDLTSSLGYHLIGAPTTSGLAPWASRYHATGSQVFKISDYITGEFLLEKVTIDIPVIVQRMRGIAAGDGTSGNRFYDSCRDIDNYMFFLYRQRQSGSPSSKPDMQYAMSASRRELVASGAASFYNSNAFSGRVPDRIREIGLPHSPSFSYDFNTPTTSSNSLSQSSVSGLSVFTGSIRVEMNVATPVGQPVGGSRFPLAGDYGGGAPSRRHAPGNRWHRSVVVQDWWLGDRTIPSSSLTCHSSYGEKSSEPAIFSNTDTYFAGLKPYAPSQNITFRATGRDFAGKSLINRSPRELITNKGDGFYTNINYEKIEQNSGRTKPGMSPENIGMLGYSKSSGGIGGQYEYPILFGSECSSAISPFVFEPGDELILGIDAGISMLPASGTSMNDFISSGIDAGADLGFYSASDGDSLRFRCMSGSFMKILTGEASLTLFGSQMKRNREVLKTSNQGLTSNAIHESIGDSRVTDQIDVPSRHELSGTYVDRLIVGRLRGINQIDINNTNDILKDGLNSFAGGASDEFRVVRGTVSLFSKNWTGTDEVDSSLNNHRSPDHDQSTGYPPSTAVLTDDSPQGWYIGPQSEWPFGIPRDPNFITPGKASFVRKAGIVSLQRFVTIPDAYSTYYDSMAPDLRSFTTNAAGADPSTATLNFSTASAPGGRVPFRIKIFTANMHRLSAYPYVNDPPRYSRQLFEAELVPSRGSNAATAEPANIFTVVKSNNAHELTLQTIFNKGFAYANSTHGFNIFTYEGAPGAFGPRYGMISPLPARPTAKFRRDSFGQFRDMLEQRQDGKFFVVDFENKGADPIRDSPVQVKFVNASDGKTIVSPYATNSTNFDNEYSSSMPYVDREREASNDSGTTITLDGTLYGGHDLLALLT